ncbi:hypothetical protein D3C83_129160 [compost metagenome]
MRNFTHKSVKGVVVAGDSNGIDCHGSANRQWAEGDGSRGWKPASNAIDTLQRLG